MAGWWARYVIIIKNVQIRVKLLQESYSDSLHIDDASHMFVLRYRELNQLGHH